MEKWRPRGDSGHATLFEPLRLFGPEAGAHCVSRLQGPHTRPALSSSEARRATVLPCPLPGTVPPAPPSPPFPSEFVLSPIISCFCGLGFLSFAGVLFQGPVRWPVDSSPSSLQPWRELVHPAAVPASGPHGRLEPGELSPPQGSHMPQTRSDWVFLCSFSAASGQGAGRCPPPGTLGSLGV